MLGTQVRPQMPVSTIAAPFDIDLMVYRCSWPCRFALLVNVAKVLDPLPL